MKIICVGLNYPHHAEEIGMERSAAPVLFLKPDTALLRDNAPFYVPDWACQFDYECELTVRISKQGRCVAAEYAHRYYDAVGLGIDFTARDLQRELVSQGRPWELCKAFDNSAALSSFIPLAQLPPLPELNFRLWLNGEERQRGNAGNMIHCVDQLVAYASRFFTLRIGDVLMTGTPPGVGPVAEGDHIRAELEARTLLDFDIK